MSIFVSIISAISLIYVLRQSIKNRYLYKANTRLKRQYIYLSLFWLLLLTGTILDQRAILFFAFVFLLLYIALRSSSRSKSVAELMELSKDLGIDKYEPYVYDRYPGAPLISAIHDGNLDKVKLLLDEGEDIEQVVGDYTPLMHAINTNNTEISLYLIEQGANVHATESDVSEESADSPISLAVPKQMQSVVRLLLHKGADPKVFNVDGYNLIDCAIEQGNEEIVSMLLEHGVIPTAKY